jgi:prophage tail gpP-like protein
LYFTTWTQKLKKAGITGRGGSMVDATFTWALKLPRRTKTMHVTLKAHQSKKGKTWRIGYKVHIGVDAAGGLVHGVETFA